MISRGFGYKKDPTDSRDSLHAFKAKHSKVALPQSATVRRSEVAVRDQKSTSSCVGQAVTNGIRVAHLMAGKDMPAQSALFTYTEAQLVGGSEYLVDAGTYIRDAFKASIKLGTCPEKIWPFIESQACVEPNWKARQAAYSERGAHKYRRVAGGNADLVKSAIASGCPVVAGWTVDESILDYDGGVLDVCDGDPIGGHAMMIESYDFDVFTLLNSWGINYGEGGRLRVTRDFIEALGDGWVVEV